MYIYKGITILTQVVVWCSGKTILTLEVMGSSPIESNVSLFCAVHWIYKDQVHLKKIK
jgi:hypothetical protein